MGISLIVGLVGFFVHLLPFFIHGAHPLGYDTGFYRRYLIEPFVSFPNAPVPGLGTDALLPRIILDILHLLHISPDLALYGSYVLFFTALPILFSLWLKPYLGKRGALIAGLLLALSPVGYTAFWYMLYKNAFALCLVLAAFIAYERRAFWPLLVLDLAIAVSHKTTAIIYIATLLTLVVIDYRRWKELLVHVIVAGVTLGLVALTLSASPGALAGSAVGVFIEWREYLTLSVGFIIAATAALFNFKQQPFPKSLLAFALASFAFPIFHLPFYERIFVFTDIALVAFAAYGVVYLMSCVDLDTHSSLVYYGSFIVICAVIGLSLGNLQRQFRELKPQETPQSLAQITTIGTLVPAHALLLTTNAEAPWYEGWTHAHIAAPGLLRDFHNFDQWVAFWTSSSTPAHIAFLDSFPKPLYISTLGNFAELVGDPLPTCFTKIADHLLRYDCK